MCAVCCTCTHRAVSKQTKCVMTLTCPRKLQTKVQTGSCWIHPPASWCMEASRHVTRPFTSQWLCQLEAWKRALRIWCNQKHKYVEFKLQPLTIIMQKINAQYNTKFVPCVNILPPTRKKVTIFFFCTQWGQIFVVYIWMSFGGVESNYPHYTNFSLDVSWWWLLVATGGMMFCPHAVGPPLLVSGCRMSCAIVDVAAGSEDRVLPLPELL